MAIRVQKAASLRLGEIYSSTRDRRDAAQPDRSITDLFAAFDQMESHGVASRPIPAAFGVEGICFRHVHHVVDRRRLPHGDVGIVTILHKRLHQMDKLRAELPKEQMGPATIIWTLDGGINVDQMLTGIWNEKRRALCPTLMRLIRRGIFGCSGLSTTDCVRLRIYSI